MNSIITHMIALKSTTKGFWKDESGATAIEYGLFAALVGAVIVASVTMLGGSTKGGFDALITAMGGTPAGLICHIQNGRAAILARSPFLPICQMDALCS